MSTNADRSGTGPVAAPPPASILVRPRVAARVLEISPRKLWELTSRGQIPCVRIGRSVRFSIAQLEEWVRARTTSNQDEPARANGNAPTSAASTRRDGP